MIFTGGYPLKLINRANYETKYFKKILIIAAVAIIWFIFFRKKEIALRSGRKTRSATPYKV